MARSETRHQSETPPVKPTTRRRAFFSRLLSRILRRHPIMPASVLSCRITAPNHRIDAIFADRAFMDVFTRKPELRTDEPLDAIFFIYFHTSRRRKSKLRSTPPEYHLTLGEFLSETGSVHASEWRQETSVLVCCDGSGKQYVYCVFLAYLMLAVKLQLAWAVKWLIEGKKLELAELSEFRDRDMADPITRLLADFKDSDSDHAFVAPEQLRQLLKYEEQYIQPERTGRTRLKKYNVKSGSQLSEEELWKRLVRKVEEDTMWDADKTTVAFPGDMPSYTEPAQPEGQ